MTLSPGDLAAHSAMRRHAGTSVTRGVRLASFACVQDAVSDDTERALLHNLNIAIHRLLDEGADPTAVVLLTSVYHDLLRKWGEA